MDANGATLRLRSLQAMGHGSAGVARAIGCHEQTVQRLVSGRAPAISLRLHQAIVTVFDAWWAKRPPQQTRQGAAAATAARRRAARCDWCEPAAPDDEMLDTAGYGHSPVTAVPVERALLQKLA